MLEQIEQKLQGGIVDRMLDVGYFKRQRIMELYKAGIIIR